MHMASPRLLVAVSVLSVSLFVYSNRAAAQAPAEPTQEIPGVGIVKPLGALDTGRAFLEGPAAAPDGTLYYTDIPNNLILRRSPAGETEVFTDESRHSNGLMLSAAGELIACEMDGRVVAWDVEKRARRVLAESYQGKPFNAPNDLVIDRAGGLYFTDPRFRAPQPLPQAGQGVYYLAADGAVTRVVADLPAPNGILLSPDERTLYVFPTDSPSLRAFDVTAPGRVSAGREFCRLLGPDGRGQRGADGATIDTAGNLYVTSPAGVQVISPRGERLGVIPTPEHPANAALVGKRLYVTARTSLYAYDIEFSNPGVEGHRYARGD